MKTFTQFIKEGTDMGAVVNGVPCAVAEFPRKKVSEQFPHWVGKGHEGDTNDFLDSNDNEEHGGVSGVHESLSVHDQHDEQDESNVHWYTANSRQRNEYLYRSHVQGNPVKAKTSMDETLEKNRLPHDLHVYSGVNWHPGDVSAKHSEGHVHLPAYTSTSTDPEVAHSFARDHAEAEHGSADEHHVIHFHLKKGQQGKYVGHTSEVPNESEYILPRNTTIKVHPKPDVYTHPYNDEKTFVWHAHPVSE